MMEKIYYENRAGYYLSFKNKHSIEKYFDILVYYIV